MGLMHRSLTKRIITLSIFWIVIALIFTAMLMGRFYRAHIEEHYDNHVQTHVEELVASMETGPDGSLILTREPTDPRFYRPDEGWYWEVVSNEQVLFRSKSLGDGKLDLQNIILDENHNVQTVYGPNNAKLRAHVVHVSYPHESGSLTFVASLRTVA